MKLTLPIPPSVNALYANLPGKGRIKTALYRSWVKQADGYLFMQMKSLKRFAGKCKIIVHLPETMRGDASNRLKAPEDFLVKRGITSDDKHNREVTAKFSPLPNKNECLVEIIGTEVGRF